MKEYFFEDGQEIDPKPLKAEFIPTEESLKRKVREECGLEISDIQQIGVGHTLFRTDPFGHGHGTDTVNVVYFARGGGALKLNDLHSEPIIVTPEKYNGEFQKNLHPFVKEWLDVSIKLI